MLDKIAHHPNGPEARLIFVGDMVDRGPQSNNVLTLLHERNQADPTRTVCLMGNHERMMLDFLDDPLQYGPRWLNNGGSDTLASFDISPWTSLHAKAPRERLEAQAKALRQALSTDTLAWLEALPLWWREGTLAVTHAGANPSRPISDQDSNTLLWGSGVQLNKPRADGLWVAHGHWVVETAHAQAGRISVDTGAWRSGFLSAAWLDSTGLTFITVQ